jgi:hypothetical protein
LGHSCRFRALPKWLPFSPRRRDSAPGGGIAGGFFVTDAEQGRPASMIEFIVIVVLLVLLIGIFVRREVSNDNYQRGRPFVAEWS